MSTKSRKSKKRKHRTPKLPPLTAVDQMVYVVLFLLMCAVLVGMVAGALYLRDSIAFADVSVVAARESASLMWLIVPWLTTALIIFAPLTRAYENRQPIFGPKMNTTTFISDRQKDLQRQTRKLLAVVLLVSFIPLPWSLYGRSCLREDGSIVQYNMFGQQTAVYGADEITGIRLETVRHRPRQWSDTWSVQIVLTNDRGKDYAFENSSFRKNTNGTRGWLNAMTQIKAQYPPESVHYMGVDGLDRVIEEHNLSESEVLRLRTLFGVTS